jgi:MerR family copper efflux transcriptional regulator
MNIGQASKEAGISAKMIRYYESIGLVPAAGRRDSGYRDYSEADLHRLRFLRRARELGFSVERIRDLMRLWSDRKRSNVEIRKLAFDHVAELEGKVLRMQEMIATLRSLAGACKGSNRPDCPIITELGGMSHAPEAPARPLQNRRSKSSLGASY